MPDPNGQGQGVNNQNGEGQGQSGSGAPAGQGQVTDQEIQITLPSGEKKTVKISDIFDDKGVPFKNRHLESSRRLSETSTELETLKANKFQESASGKGESEGAAPGTYTDPSTGEKLTEEDLNRMFMTGEGAKAQKIILANVDVRSVVRNVITEQDVKAKTVSRYPDLNNKDSEFFKRTANYMAQNNLFGTPNGLAFAAAKVAEDMSLDGTAFTKGVSSSGGPEGQRSSQTGAGVVPGGGSGRGQTPTVELDEQGKALAAKLGVDPAKMQKRLENYLAAKERR